MMLFWVLTNVLLILFGLIAVAFVTLLERKVLGLTQIRLGPNKTSYMGALQPVSDGVKLLLKDFFFLTSTQSFFFLVSPFLVMIMFMSIWVVVLPWSGGVALFKNSSLLMFSFLGIGAYVVIMTGLSSVSSFSKLGGLRGMLQNLSFEVSLILLFMTALVLFKSLALSGEELISLELIMTWSLLWFFLSLMETNRAPFDLLEGESELISGFNVEISSFSFVFLFLSEYGMMIVLSMVFSSVVNSALWAFLFLGGMLLMRSCFPRLRYDVMMSMMWSSLLPLSITGFLTSFSLFCCMVNKM